MELENKEFVRFLKKYYKDYDIKMNKCPNCNAKDFLQNRIKNAAPDCFVCYKLLCKSCSVINDYDGYCFKCYEEKNMLQLFMD